MQMFEKGPIPVREINDLRDLWVGSVNEYPERPVFPG